MYKIVVKDIFLLYAAIKNIKFEILRFEEVY